MTEDKAIKTTFEPDRKKLKNFYARILVKIGWSLVLYVYFIFLTKRYELGSFFIPIVAIMTILLLIDGYVNIKNERYLIVKLSLDGDKYVLDYLDLNEEKQIELSTSTTSFELEKYRFGRGVSPNYGLIITSNSEQILVQKGNMSWSKEAVKEMYEILKNT